MTIRGRLSIAAPTYRMFRDEQRRHSLTRQSLTECTNDLTAHRLHLAVARRQCDLALERMREAEGRVEDLRNQLASVLDVRVYGPGGAPTIEGVET